MYIREDSKNAIVTRTNALISLGRFEQAIKHCEEVRSMFEHDTQIQDCHRRAVFEYRKSKRPDYYTLLGTPYVSPSDA